MTRSKLSSKVILLATSIGLSTAAFAGSAVAQSYPDAYSCPIGQVYDPTYGCTWPYDYDYGGYGLYYGGHRDFGHGFGHGMGGDFNHGMSFAHAGGGFGGFHGGGGFGGGGHR